MASYRLEIKKSAARELEVIGQKAHHQRIVAKIESLAQDPRPSGCEKLAGSQNEYRVRQGDFRVIYEIHDARLVVIAVRVRNRREAYR